MANEVRRTKRLDTRRKPKMTNEQLLAFLAAGINASKNRDYQADITLEAHHKFSTALVNKYAAIFVGDVSSSKLAKTKLAKSIYDAGWCQLKNQIQYKAVARGVIFEVVDEAYTTQTCSCCGAISPSSPKGRAGLGIREWTCVECGVLHDRDVNAARNILAAGHSRLAGGIPFL